MFKTYNLLTVTLIAYLAIVKLCINITLLSFYYHFSDKSICIYVKSIPYEPQFTLYLCPVTNGTAQPFAGSVRSFHGTNEYLL